MVYFDTILKTFCCTRILTGFLIHGNKQGGLGLQYYFVKISKMVTESVELHQNNKKYEIEKIGAINTFHTTSTFYRKLQKIPRANFTTRLASQRLLRQSKRNVCLRKYGWRIKYPPGRQGIHFFSNFQTIHTN